MGVGPGVGPALSRLLCLLLCVFRRRTHSPWPCVQEGGFGLSPQSHGPHPGRHSGGNFRRRCRCREIRAGRDVPRRRAHISDRDSCQHGLCLDVRHRDHPLPHVQRQRGGQEVRGLWHRRCCRNVGPRRAHVGAGARVRFGKRHRGLDHRAARIHLHAPPHPPGPAHRGLDRATHVQQVTRMP